MYDVFVLNANASPRKSLANPINAFFASSAAKRGVSAAANKVPMLSKDAEKKRKNSKLHDYLNLTNLSVVT